MKDDKYIVFKRQEFYEMMGQLALPPWTDGKGDSVGGELDCAVLSEKIQEQAEGWEITDATVIRSQDIFSGPALHEYAGQISTTLEIMDMLGVLPTHPAVDRLRSVRDYFSEQAANADAASFKKVPD